MSWSVVGISPAFAFSTLGYCCELCPPLSSPPIPHEPFCDSLVLRSSGPMREGSAGLHLSPLRGRGRVQGSPCEPGVDDDSQQIWPRAVICQGVARERKKPARTCRDVSMGIQLGFMNHVVLASCEAPSKVCHSSAVGRPCPSARCGIIPLLRHIGTHWDTLGRLMQMHVHLQHCRSAKAYSRLVPPGHRAGRNSSRETSSFMEDAQRAPCVCRPSALCLVSSKLSALQSSAG
jgi:hypothetical protein